MGHRKDGEHHVPAADFVAVVRREHIGAEIPVREHYALCLACGSAGVDDGRGVQSGGNADLSVASIGTVFGFDEGESLDVNDEVESLESLLAQLGKLLFGEELCYSIFIPILCISS